MPQLVKGGKHTYGWTQVGERGHILLPPEAMKEYKFKHSTKLFMLPGSKKSGGFSVASPESISRTPLAAVLKENPDLGNFQLPEGALVDYQGRLFTWVEMQDGIIQVPEDTLQHYGVSIGDRLLVIRGSDLGIAFAVRGLIIEEANKHQDLAVFRADS